MCLELLLNFYWSVITLSIDNHLYLYLIPESIFKHLAFYKYFIIFPMWRDREVQSLDEKEETLHIFYIILSLHDVMSLTKWRALFLCTRLKLVAISAKDFRSVKLSPWKILMNNWTCIAVFKMVLEKGSLLTFSKVSPPKCVASFP